MTTYNARHSTPFLLLLLCFVYSLAGCSKSDSSTPGKEKGTMSCKLDGVLHEFNSMVNANDRPSGDSVHFVVVSGHETDDPKSPSFGIHLVDPINATAKTYTTADAELHGQYCVQNIRDGQIVSTTCYMGTGSNGSHFTLTITAIDDWGVKGTFSGRLEMGGGDAYITVTEGQFSAPYN